MKKLLVVLVAAAALFAFSSCDKTCNCKTYVNGSVVVENEVELDKDSQTKCSDLNTVAEILGQKNGIECR
ncbi:MAG: hypothetical protein HUK15_01720 [Bacteroidales bacterium]|nr:hypothetical protein [Bacteroidales bacterium]